MHRKPRCVTRPESLVHIGSGPEVLVILIRVPKLTVRVPRLYVCRAGHMWDAPKLASPLLATVAGDAR
jgi:hypothetical protein